MSTTLTYGIYLGLANVALTLVGYFLGYQGEAIANGRWFQYLMWAVMITLVVLGIRAVREESPHKSLSYGRGVGSAALIGLFGGLIAGVYAFIHFKFVNPSFVDYLIDFVRNQPNAANMSDAQLAGMEKGMRFFYNPVMLAVISPLFNTCFCTIIGLIAAIFLKRAAPEGAEPPPM
jgi:tetrahydromethanopterin S-methyltransferase subunit C